MIEYTIIIRNDDKVPAYNLSVWDTLPANLGYQATLVGGAPVLGPGQYIQWDLGSGVIKPGDAWIIKFKVVITATGGAPIENAVTVDYNDPRYAMPEKHPPITATASLYPSDKPIVFPNPYDRGTAYKGLLKIDNLVPGSVVAIFTIAGDNVISMKADQMKIEWDGKNRFGKDISPGIYYYTVSTPRNQVVKGKLLVVGSE